MIEPGTTFLHFRLAEKIGEGGMGVVWRAVDTTLGRDVAIKVLPAAFASDPERLLRFEREAKVLASLNHPGIAGIYGLHESDGVRFLEMEYVPGEDLAARLQGGALALAEALDIARQIADALETAHEQGVVHRDLKPANVKITPDGKVKLLDFGLAKALDSGSNPSPASNVMNSPTITSLGTVAGVILGTAAYMSPEQARGKGVDKRADIWAFGCVVYEMLAGRRLFAGETISDTLAAVLAKEPDFAALPAAVPAPVRELLRRCVEKDARKRLRDIGDARLELEDGRRSETAPGMRKPAAFTGRRTSPVLLVAAGVVAGAVGVGTWARVRQAPSAAPQVTRLAIDRPGSPALSGPGTFAIAPDGSAVALLAATRTGSTALWIRELDDPAPHAIVGTDGASFPFWSPDSRHVAFFADGKLQRVPRSGGAVQNVCDAAAGRGGAWGASDVIVFAPTPFGPLSQVEASGGIPAPATELDSTRAEGSHRFPFFLPDGRHFVYVIQPEVQPNLMQASIAALDDPHGKPLLLSSFAPRCAGPGTLVFTRGQALVAQHIDSRTLTMTGAVLPLADRVQVSGSISGTPPVDCARNGTLIHDRPDERPTELVWVDRNGRPMRTIVQDPGQLSEPALSHDGDRLAVVDFSTNEEVLRVFDLARGTNARLSVPNQTAVGAVWSVDDRRVVALLAETGKMRIAAIDATSGSEQVLLPTSGRWMVPTAIGPDGTIVLGELRPGGKYDVVTVASAGGETRPYMATPADERVGSLSPDGRCMAYTSDASGRLELYVDHFPEARGAVRISTDGSSETIWWRDDGREIYFVSGDAKTLLACDVRATAAIEVGHPHALFALAEDIRGIVPTSRGDRFLVLQPVGPRATSLVVVQNWSSQLD